MASGSYSTAIPALSLLAAYCGFPVPAHRWCAGAVAAASASAATVIRSCSLNWLPPAAAVGVFLTQTKAPASSLPSTYHSVLLPLREQQGQQLREQNGSSFNHSSSSEAAWLRIRALGAPSHKVFRHVYY